MVAASYWRFLVQHDNRVSYEIPCSPLTHSCYVLCEDEAIDDLNTCPKKSLHYYAVIERNAADLVTLCGDTITDCKTAHTCTETETLCTIDYCDPTSDEFDCSTTNENTTKKPMQVGAHNNI